MLSIRVKIILITIAAIITSILSVIIVCDLTIEKENQEISAKTMNLLCQSTQKSVNEHLESIEQSVEMAANIASDTLDSVVLVENGITASTLGEVQLTDEQAEELDSYMAAYCDKVKEAFASVASHTNGVITYYYCINPSVTPDVHGFFYSKVGKTGFDEQEPLDARELDPEDIEHTTWYYTPIERGRPSWVGPYTAHFLNELLTCSYLIPIYKSGILIGVLGMDIPLETLVEDVDSIGVYDTGYACLLTEDGSVIYHPDMEFGSVPDPEEFSINPEILLKDNSGEELISYKRGNQEWKMAFSTLSNGMKLVITAPESEINASWTRLTRIILIDGLVIIAVFSVILMFALGFLTRPLKKLTAASQKLAAGDYEVELDYKGRDEVGTLTKAFNNMRDSIKRYIEDLNRRVVTDDLTGLPNMRHFLDIGEKERLRLIEEGKTPAVMYFNMIGMKFFNRQYGFSEGDKLICSAANILADRFGDQNVSRFGQDHLVVITDGENIKETLKALFLEIQDCNEGKSLPVRVGVCLADGDDVNMSRACDRAKYACDRLSGAYDSCYCIFDDDMLESARNNRYILDHLDQAIREKWIQVYYQPIIRAANGKVCDEEALSRWIDPERGMLSPDLFIPILENSRLIYKLDLYVLDEILKKMKIQKEAGVQIIPNSLNLSRVDFETCDIVEEVCSRVDAAGIPRSKISVEVTESMIGQDFEFMKQQVERFRSLGFKVWMDDFGSGYSALDVLQDIRFDLIKFDMRFLERFDDGNESKIILTEMIKMAISLGVETVVEGVETEEEADFLKDIGCTKLQGYFYCKPVSPEQIAERYKKGVQIGFENLDEEGYYTAIGKINLYDFGSIANEGGEDLGNFFETLPMAVLESDGEYVQIIRCNKSYRDFTTRVFTGGQGNIFRRMEVSRFEAGPGSPFVKAMLECREEGSRVFINETLPDGSAMHALLSHIAVNPVTGIYACVAAILGISKATDQGSDVRKYEMKDPTNTDTD